jgi:hypothetical protein
MFDNKDNTPTQIPLHTEVAALLKKKFDLYGDVGSFPLNQDHIEKIQFQLGCQGFAERGEKTRDVRAVEFLQTIYGDVSVTKIPDPHSLYPDFEKMTVITLDASRLGNVKAALEILIEEPQPPAAFAKC